MGKKLSIVVTHYKERWELCKSLFDSIALQQAVPFDAIEVIVVQDGEEGKEEIFKKIDYLPCDYEIYTVSHKGVSAARNYGLDKSTGEYVMFCDCDDMFVNNYGLHLVFSAMQDIPDVVVNNFAEETKNEDGSLKLVRHENDVTFIHGKCYKRQFLIDKEIRFNESLTIHEDCFFNTIAITCADTKRTIETPYYLWKWNDESTVRQDPANFVMKTYPELMKVRAAIAKDLERRGFINEYIDCVLKTVLDSYYDFNKESYLAKENQKHVNRAKHAFKKFYEEFEQTYKDAATKRKAELALNAKVNAYKYGLVMESFTIKEFINEIKNEVK